MSDNLQELGQELIGAAAKYWQEYQRVRGGSAVVWLEGTNGELIVFTRSENKTELLRGVFEIDGPPLHKDFFFNKVEV